MIARSSASPSPRRGALDALVVLWCVFWVVLGVAVGGQMWQAAKLTDTVVSSGHGLHDAGDALSSLAGVPLVGDRAVSVGATVQRTADDIVAGAQTARGSMRRLAVLLGGSVMLVPLAPVLGLYLPIRRRSRRDLRDVTRLISSENAVDVDAFLAHRAITQLPYAALLRFTANPAADFANGNFRRLADAELAHLGLRRGSSGGSGEGSSRDSSGDSIGDSSGDGQ